MAKEKQKSPQAATFNLREYLRALLRLLASLFGLGGQSSEEIAKHGKETLTPLASPDELREGIMRAMTTNDKVAARRVIITLDAEIDKL